MISFGLYNNLRPLFNLVLEHKPDLVFNLSEAFNNNRDLESNLTAFLQLMNIPFTGSSPFSLKLCKDKALTKIILNHHQIKTPQFLVAQKNSKLPSLKNFKFPAFIKPLNLESSEGIALASYVENENEALSRINFIHQSLKADVIVEEFIDGREIYVGLLGNETLKVLPPRELFFKDIEDHIPKFATYKSKWDNKYRKKWGIESGWMKNFSELSQRRLFNECKKIYKILKIQGYGRIDFRIKGEEIYFIEANPNPSIARKEDYSLSAAKAGMSYSELLNQIIVLALETFKTQNSLVKQKKSS